MHADLRGFYGAPVTYAASLAIGAASSATLLFDMEGPFSLLGRDAVVRRGQYWRLWSSQLAFHHGLAASFGLYIIFQFRVLERQMGSRKFGSLVFFIWTISALLKLAALLSMPSLARRLPPGPYALLGALTVFFMKFVPRLHPKAYSIVGINFSDKSSTYVLMAAILLHDPRKLLSYIPGMLLGVLFSSTPLSKLRLPGFVCVLFSVRRRSCCTQKRFATNTECS
ncbi:hypothetical protein PINS_up004456 [Pythium insidiosum]|nr:hypothetical protein PINS_up004456 [Pythium insidiosum]